MSSISLCGILETNKLVRPNFDNWYRYLRIVLMHKKLIYVIDKPTKMFPTENDVKGTKALFGSKLTGNSPVAPYVNRMIDLIEELEKLGCKLGKELSQDLILQSLSESFSQFVINFNIHKMDCDLATLRDKEQDETLLTATDSSL
ncbi:uncharacterized protein LOC142167052 [Nicotiana tabacum]|uniref:Uncharacterized protein LOC142167052 n=1 Tax=Nicotiana tabacum TaxID=4097 RepID=A0AC58SEA3_TOBAC